MIAHIQPSSLNGSLQAAASKSSMQRACAAALVANGISIIRNPGHSNDDLAAMRIIEDLGASARMEGDDLHVSSWGVKPITDSIHCGESGLSIRMFTPLAALSETALTIHGEGSLVDRPMDFFDEILPRLQVSITSKAGKLPLTVQGPIVPANIEIDGSLSSQFLTGLLFAYAASDARDVTIRVNGLKSKPYIDLTLDVMHQFGLKIPEVDQYETFYFSAEPHNSAIATREYTVESDWSGAAFLLVAGAIAGPLEVKGLSLNSAQADRAILQALIAAGAGISISPEAIELRPKALQAFHFNATDCPDLFPPLVALAAYCTGKTVVEGVRRLTHKESNRGITLQQEFGKMGVKIELQDDLMIIEGTGKVLGASVHSHHDHRIAMACAVAALRASGDTSIEEAEAINKSYPDFYTHLKAAGASVKLD